MATLRQVFSDIASAIRANGVKGTFKPIEMAQKIRDIADGIDYGYLTFTAEEATTLTLKQNESIAPHKLLKSTDGVNWTKWENPAANGISLNIGESVYIKADEDALTRTATSTTKYNQFSSTGRISCDGDIRSILNKVVAPGDYEYWFLNLFNGCSSLTQAPELPAATLASQCYYIMFRDCTSLTTPPELPATTLATQCYYEMFYNCTSLTTAPELPATTLASGCYYEMFTRCSSLTTPPELPATTLANSCYRTMLAGCTSLTTPPELPATTLASNCYNSMFDGCSSLTSAPELPDTTLASLCYYGMFSGCTSLTSAPELPATELPKAQFAKGCYSSMFSGCTSLKRIKMNASSGNWGTNMFYGCTSLELVDMTGSTGVPTLSNVNNFSNTNDTYKIVVPDSLYDTWIAATNWASIASHIMKKSDWNAAHPDDQL